MLPAIASHDGQDVLFSLAVEEHLSDFHIRANSSNLTQYGEVHLWLLDRANKHEDEVDGFRFSTQIHAMRD